MRHCMAWGTAGLMMALLLSVRVVGQLEDSMLGRAVTMARRLILCLIETKEGRLPVEQVDRWGSIYPFSILGGSMYVTRS